MPQTPHLDKIDRRLLSPLQGDGRLGKPQLSMQVGPSQSACLRRVQRPERTGVIEGHGARLSPAALERAETVFVERAATVCPEMLECHLIEGDYDLLLRVALASAADCERLHRRRWAALPNVACIRSLFALRRVVLHGPGGR